MKQFVSRCLNGSRIKNTGCMRDLKISECMQLRLIFLFLQTMTETQHVYGNIEIILNEGQETNITIEDPLMENRKECSCGANKYAGKLAIVGGQEAMRNEFPWMAIISSATKGPFCGGSLINDYYVLTAAHCLINETENSISVIIGAHNKYERGSPAFRIWVERFKVHSKFNPRNLIYDIALLKLKRRVYFDWAAQPICLPTQEVNYEGLKGTVAGWGRTAEGGGSTSVLLKVQIPIRPAIDCKKNLFVGNKNDILCAYYDEGKMDACQGDSGGPLMIRQGKGWQIIGIVSWGIGCARAHSPAGYTKVFRYMDWIKRRVKGTTLCNH